MISEVDLRLCNDARGSLMELNMGYLSTLVGEGDMSMVILVVVVVLLLL